MEFAKKHIKLINILIWVFAFLIVAGRIASSILMKQGLLNYSATVDLIAILLQLIPLAILLAMRYAATRREDDEKANSADDQADK